MISERGIGKKAFSLRFFWKSSTETN